MESFEISVGGYSTGHSGKANFHFGVDSKVSLASAYMITVTENTFTMVPADLETYGAVPVRLVNSKRLFSKTLQRYLIFKKTMFLAKRAEDGTISVNLNDRIASKTVPEIKTETIKQAFRNLKSMVQTYNKANPANQIILEAKLGIMEWVK
jgi:hypothetical protein